MTVKDRQIIITYHHKVGIIDDEMAEEFTKDPKKFEEWYDNIPDFREE